MGCGGKILAQRARIGWLKARDQNTKFLHLCTIQRRKKNKVLRLRTDEDLWLYREEEISERTLVIGYSSG